MLRDHVSALTSSQQIMLHNEAKAHLDAALHDGVLDGAHHLVHVIRCVSRLRSQDTYQPQDIVVIKTLTYGKQAVRGQSASD